MSIQDQKTLHFNLSEISLTLKRYVASLTRREINNYLLERDVTRRILYVNYFWR